MAQDKHCLVRPQTTLYWFAKFAIDTGMHRNELTTFRCSQIDLERGVARLADTKNGELGTVPLPGPGTASRRRLCSSAHRPGPVRPCRIPGRTSGRNGCADALRATCHPQTWRRFRPIHDTGVARRIGCLFVLAAAPGQYLQAKADRGLVHLSRSAPPRQAQSRCSCCRSYRSRWCAASRGFAGGRR